MSLLDHAVPTLLTADLPGVGGRIKVEPEDFVVEEIPAYEPSGEGDSLYLWVEKRDVGAEFFSRQIAKRLGVRPEDVGTAGLKDRRAVTRQWVSAPASAEANLAKIDGEGITLLKTSRHTNKLKPGHLRGNAFRILLRDCAPEAAERLPALVSRLKSHGMPNFYGSQRFGRDGGNVTLGMELIAGTAPRINPFLRRFALSAVQSALFNRYVSERMRDGLMRTVLLGDVMMKWPFGGMFTAQDVAAEQARFDAREIVQGGPMYGKKMFASHDEAARREAELLRSSGLALDAFRGFGKLLSGTRRYGIVYVDDLAAEATTDGVRVSFTLPAGSYATVLIAELTHAAVEGEEE